MEIGPLRPEAVLTARGISHASPFPDSGSQDPNDLVRFQLIRLAFHPIKDALDDFRISHSLCHTQSLRRTLSCRANGATEIFRRGNGVPFLSTAVTCQLRGKRCQYLLSEAILIMGHKRIAVP